MSAAVVASPQQEDLAQKVPGWEYIARTMEVTDQPSLQRAANYIQSVKALLQEADETFDPIIKKAHEAHKEAIAQKKRITEPLLTAENTLKTKIGVHMERERQAREEEERRLRLEAERQAAEQREAQIENAEASGASREEVSALAEAPLYVAPVVRAAPPKVNGISARDGWRAEVTDLLALVRYIGNNPQYLNLIQPNPVALGGMARTLRSAMNIPGVRVTNAPVVSVRGRA